MGAVLNFDASGVAPSTGTQDAIPAGWYNAIIDESELKPTKANDGGMYLELRFSVIDGQYAGRKVYTRLNVRNSNPVAAEIAFKDLSAICHSVGILRVGDSAELHNHPMKIKVKHKAASGDYEASNEISAYRNINEQVSTAPQAGIGQPQFPAQAPTPPAQSAPAWAPAPAANAAPAPQFAPPPAQQQPQQQQFPQQQPAAQQQPAWQPPAATQPWAGQPAAQQPAPQQQFPQQQPAAQFPGAVPPWQQPQG